MNESKDEKIRLFMAVALSGIILFGWQVFVEPKINPRPTKAPVESTTETKVQDVNAISNVVKTTDTNTLKPDSALIDKSFLFKTSNASVELTNKFVFKNFDTNQAKFPFKEIVDQNDALRIMARSNDGLFEEVVLDSYLENNGSHQFENSVKGIKIIFTDDEKGKLNFSLSSREPMQFRFILNSNIKLKQEDIDAHKKREYIFFSDSVERFEIGKDNDARDANLKWFGVDFSHHLFSVVFNSQNLGVVSTKENKMFVDIIKPQTQLDGFLVYTIKNYDFLTDLGSNLKNAVNFGFFWPLAVPTLKALQFFHGVIPNYGISIIILTILIRLALFPLQVKSTNSMKKMQLLQPEIENIKKKYKDDQARLQKETMELFKKSGANPLGGCLPLLLQLPVFFAFYGMLGESVELVGASFIRGWINDLSIKDPFYALPVLSGVLMFLQQKITPMPSADPMQRKLMLFLMPAIFIFFCKSLPAGLNLYIFISTMFGILTHFILLKKNN